jgi:hypothetical protein
MAEPIWALMMVSAWALVFPALVRAAVHSAAGPDRSLTNLGAGVPPASFSQVVSYSASKYSKASGWMVNGYIIRELSLID